MIQIHAQTIQIAKRRVTITIRKHEYYEDIVITTSEGDKYFMDTRSDRQRFVEEFLATQDCC